MMRCWLLLILVVFLCTECFAVSIRADGVRFGSGHSVRLHKSSVRRPHRTSAFGSLFDTYLATLTIDGRPYTCILDTGSSDFSVAASAECGCAVYYNTSACHDDVHLAVRYGDGNWTGAPCTGEVSIGGLNIGAVVFAGMRSQSGMLECHRAHADQNGIIGLAFRGLIGPPVNYSAPLMDVVADRSGVDNEFALQCCGWSDDDGDEYASGALDIGGVDAAHFAGPIAYTAVTERLFWAVDMIDVRIGGTSVMPKYRRANTAQYRLASEADDIEEGESAGGNDQSWAATPFQPQTIVDSGTSNLIFTEDLFTRTVQQIKRLVPAGVSDGVWSGDECVPHRADGTSAIADWPMIELVFAEIRAGDTPFVLSLPPCRYMAAAPISECSNGVAGHTFSLESIEANEGNILGQVLYEQFYVVHSAKHNRVGFAPLRGCRNDADCIRQSRIYNDTVLRRVTHHQTTSLGQKTSVSASAANFDVRNAIIAAAILLALGTIAAVVVYANARSERNGYQIIPDAQQ